MNNLDDKFMPAFYQGQQFVINWKFNLYIDMLLMNKQNTMSRVFFRFLLCMNKVNLTNVSLKTLIHSLPKPKSKRTKKHMFVSKRSVQYAIKALDEAGIVLAFGYGRNKTYFVNSNLIRRYQNKNVNQFNHYIDAVALYLKAPSVSKVTRTLDEFDYDVCRSLSKHESSKLIDYRKINVDKRLKSKNSNKAHKASIKHSAKANTKTSKDDDTKNTKSSHKHKNNFAKLKNSTNEKNALATNIHKKHQQAINVSDESYYDVSFR